MILFFIILTSCAIQKNNNSIEDYWNEIYGENRIEIRDNQFYEIIIRVTYNKNKGRYENSSSLLPLFCEQEPEYYQGDLYSIEAEITNTDAGDKVQIVITSYNENTSSYGAAFSLDYYSYNKWYPLNPYFSYPTAEYYLLNNNTAQFTLSDRTLAQATLFSFDDKNGCFLPNDSPRVVKLRKGHYRFRTEIKDTSTGKYYPLQCEFDIK